MVSREQKKLQKRKAKEKEDHNKILARRSKIRAVARDEKEEKRRERRITKLQKEMDDFEHLSKEQLESLSDSALSQLERNAKILKYLEKEYNDEVAKKRGINEDLEKKGHLTLEDKMSVLQNNKLIKPNIQLDLGGSAGCSMKPSPKKDTAVVEVVKDNPKD